MMQIEDLRLAAALLRESSLSAAARSLGVTPPALSMRLRKLEASLGLVLANRTSRKLHLTSEGERFGREAHELLLKFDGLRESLQRDDRRLTGTLRVAASFGYGRTHVAPLLSRFSRLHPALRLQFDLRETPWPDKHDSDAVVHVGSVRDSSWVGHTLASNERWLCASPGYLREHGTPRNPADLAYHACICIRENDEDVTLWHMRPAGSSARRNETLRINPAFITNDGSVARQWAEDGLGIVLRSQWDAAEALAAGRLERVMADWEFGAAPVVVLVPTRKGRSARVQALVSFLLEAGRS
ncbi:MULTISPECIES: LysR family transcriptional regulator [unclassified Variovorax]|uniref:LysR family transcriptional regulator n=1 Tax=unclassified Variovorax TaxID=663243 RepID=UPI00076BF3EF|nr:MULTISPECIES: LysR family transcriptional regulator [unclassified Variovorax]KWT78638.1 Transcriptional regulator, LysR family [Variovorax sp. WDL1]PNG52942.1 HTH-type transcriptional regulator DmlR [Variovorax sp. B2]PNG53514.1 HTH-type transcriptional regulator DmlR [Variovorax sp. B4]VTV10934.1 D-malate degradation protein R [Variovorax sp. WDL1]